MNTTTTTTTLADADFDGEFPAYDRPIADLTELSYASSGLTAEGQRPATRSQYIQVFAACLARCGQSITSAELANAQTEVSLRERLTAAGAGNLYNGLKIGRGITDLTTVHNMAFDLFTWWRFGAIQSIF